MNLKPKKALGIPQGILLLASIFLLGIFLYFGIYSQANVTFRTYDDTSQIGLNKGTFNLGEYQGNYETVVLGGISCTGKPGSHYCYSSSFGGADFEGSFSNSLKNGQTLTLSSSISGEDSQTKNYIKTDITLPAGKLFVDWNYQISIEDTKASPESGLVVLQVGDQKINAVVPIRSTGKGDAGSFEIVLEDEENIEMSIFTKNHDYKSTSANGELLISFIADPISENQGTSTETQTQNPSNNQESQTEETSTEELGFFAKINLWIDNFFKKIFG